MSGSTIASRTTALTAALIDAGTERALAPGHILCTEGDDSDEAYIVLSGQLDASVAGHAGDISVAEHGQGALVGEVTTLIGGRRTATLTTTTADARVVVVDRNSLQAVFAQHPEAAGEVLRRARERTDRTRVAALLSHELQAQDAAAVAAIARCVTWRSLNAGETLFRRGDTADAAYLVVSGRLLLDELDGDAHDAAIEIGRGGIIGEFGLLESRGRSATVTAIRDTSLARLGGDDFRELTVDHTELAMGLVRRIIDRNGRENASASSSRSFAIAVTAEIDVTERAAMIARMQTALAACGPTTLLDADGVDGALGFDGLADTPSGSFGEVRLSELFHQSETDADHMMLDLGACAGTTDDPRPNWTRRALQHADQVVIVTSPNPNLAEHGRIRRLLDLAPPAIPHWIALLHPQRCGRPVGGRELRDRYGVDEVHHLRRHTDDDVARLARLAAGRGVGLVLSGGGARGHAHIGVLRALLEQSVPVDRVVGASMGSIVAAMTAQGRTPAEALADMKDGAGDLLDYTLPIVSLVKGDRIVKVLDKQFGDLDFDDLWIRFACTSTNMTTAQSIVHRDGPIGRAIRASISIPGVLPPVVDGDHLLADGGILDNLPVGVLADDPSIGTIIASDVAPPLGPRAKGDYGLSVSGWAALRSKFIPRVLTRRRAEPAPKLPGVAGTLMRAMLIGSSQSRDDHLASGAIDLYLDLDLRTVSLLDFGQVDSATALGYEAANGRVAEWLAERNGSVWGQPCS